MFKKLVVARLRTDLHLKLFVVARLCTDLYPKPFVVARLHKTTSEKEEHITSRSDDILRRGYFERAVYLFLMRPSWGCKSKSMSKEKCFFLLVSTFIFMTADARFSNWELQYLEITQIIRMLRVSFYYFTKQKRWETKTNLPSLEFKLTTFCLSQPKLNVCIRVFKVFGHS